MGGSKWSTWGGRTVALVLAFFLWLYAVTEHVYTREIAVPLYVHDPVSVVGQPPVVVANPVPGYVRIRVSGRGRDLLRLDAGSYALHLRPEGGPGTTRTYELTSDMVDARDDVKTTVTGVVSPREVEIALDWRMQRYATVRVRVRVRPAERYVLVGDVQIEPRTVEISGASSQVRKISEVATDSVAVEDVQEDVDRYVPLVAPEGVRCRIEPPRVKLHADIQILAQDDILQVPVGVRNDVTGRFRVEPARVRVRVKGGIDIIAGLDPEQDIGLYVDASDYHGEPLAIRHGELRCFEVLEIVPAYVHLIER